MTDDILSGLMRVNRQWIKFCKGRLAPYQYVGAMRLIVAYAHKYPGPKREAAPPADGEGRAER